MRRSRPTRRGSPGASEGALGAQAETADLMGFFAGSSVGLAAFRTVERAISELGEHAVRVGRSQVVFRRRRDFAYLWRPGQYVDSDVPVVLSLALRHRLHSTRFKEVVHPSHTTWMHHLEIRSEADLDDEVRGWLGLAYAEAA